MLLKCNQVLLKIFLINNYENKTCKLCANILKVQTMIYSILLNKYCTFAFNSKEFYLKKHKNNFSYFINIDKIKNKK